MTMRRKPITVTQPYLPPLEEFIPYLEQIWESKSLTNNGPFHVQLEKALCDYFGVEHLALFANGTMALITALQTSADLRRSDHHALLLRRHQPFVAVEQHHAGVCRYRARSE
jgi:dTDP-4-amino-4,6-dideoxygalactose transaminase